MKTEDAAAAAAYLETVNSNPFPAGIAAGDILVGRLRERQDCPFAFADCQLSLGHPRPHCCTDPDGSGRYLMVDDNGRILREL